MSFARTMRRRLPTVLETRLAGFTVAVDIQHLYRDRHPADTGATFTDKARVTELLTSSDGHGNSASEVQTVTFGDPGKDAFMPGIGVAGVTAWNALHARAELRADDRVLVLGASGGVGSMAVQLAHAAGAVVWGQTTQAEKTAAIEEGGADRVVVTDADGLVGAVAELEPTVILDGLGGAYTAASVDALVPLGRLVVYGTSADVESTLNLRVLYRKAVSLLGYGGLVVADEERRRVLADLLAQVAAGTLRVPVELVPLSQAAECHRRILERGLTGKLVLDARA
jgi:NADPH2:quinone reductase